MVKHNEELNHKAEQKQQILKELAEKELQLRDAGNELSRLKTNLSNFENGLKAHESDSEFRGYVPAGGPKVSFGNHEAEKMHAQLKDSISTAKRELEGFLLTYAPLKEDVEKLKSALNENLSVSAEDILHAQRELESVSVQISKIKASIEARTEELSTDSEACKSYKSLLQQRENVLAGIELGETSKDDLKELDNQLAKQRSLSENRNLALTQTLAGLQRKLAEAEKYKEIMNFVHKELLTSYMLNEVEQIGSEYVKAAAILEEKFKQAIGIQEVFNSFTGPRGPIDILGHSYHEIQIPALILEAFAPQKISDNGHLFEGLNVGDIEELSRSQYLSKLNNLGISIL